MTVQLATPTARPAGRWQRALTVARPQRVGVVRSVVGLTVEVTGLPLAVGDLVDIDAGGWTVGAEVVGLGRDSSRCMPLGPVDGLRIGAPARSTGHPLTIGVGQGLLGRVLDGLGRPIDGKGPLRVEDSVPVTAQAPSALERARVDQPLSLGVRVLDTLVTAGRGQRLGLFAGSGVGKSSLLSMIARGTDATVNVIALVGERGREVREFLEDDLGPEGLARSVVVVATSDEPPVVRLRAAFTATRVAEYFRDQGTDVVLMMDSLTRAAMAQREIGLSVGEPPATRGYPPSTFSMLAQLLERAGTGSTGSVTGIYTVLVDGDDHNEPIADAARSILDGHVVLDRKLAVTGHFPSVDAIASISRVASRVTTAEQRAAATALRSVLAARRQAQDLIDVGAYVAGSNPRVDAAVAHADAIDAFLRQDVADTVDAEQSWGHLSALVAGMGVMS
ncbi:flagellum-specific ATP synthase [Georgenia satyanarayanai]|uniref:Flagellum-specific ATP synthase n=1 Tax=Georgenia satyanarayanai TaxID=860221 RepID=A0A2Y9A4F7_9MICO|nr:FliI/YscN family ATPase [Georgenia satyanarayanai]PYG01071.1 flagellum-specific ATP synthase [Georgenia satyanarayanai]SSA39310.1 flagellum-specific ATP synthase [Georgenia satyanarayanai]